MSDIPLVVRVAANLDVLRANLAEGVNQIETTSRAMQQMATAYDGSRAIAQAGAVVAAIGGIQNISKLTTDEQQRALTVIDQAMAKYQALGKEVPPSMQAIATAIRGNQTQWESFVAGFDVKGAISDPMTAASGAVAAVTEAMGPAGIALAAGAALAGTFATAAFDMADKAGKSGERLYDLSLKTGIAIEPLSRLSKAATIAGGDIDQVGTAMFMFGKNVEEHGDKVSKGMDKIGLSLSDIKKLQPDQQFLAIAQALGKIQDPMERNAAASELFGRAARDLMPLLLDINDAMDRTSKMGVWTSEQAKQAKEFEMDLRQIGLQVDAVEMGIGKQLLPTIRELTSFATEHLGILPAFLGPITRTVDQLKDIERIVNYLSGGGGPKAPDVKPPTVKLDTSVDDQAKAMADAEVAAARLQARLAGLADATAGLSLQQMANIETLHKMGASDKEIAGLVQTSVDAVHAYIEHEKDLAKQLSETDAILMMSFEKRTAGLKAVTDANLKAYDFAGQIENLYSLMTAEEALAKDVYGQLTSEKDRAKVVEELGLRRVEITNQIQALEQKHAGVVNAQIIAELEARRQLEAQVGRNVDGSIGEYSAYDKLGHALDELHQKKVEGIDQYQQENLLIKQYMDGEYAAAVAIDAEIQALAKKKAALDAVADSMIRVTMLSLPQAAGSAQEQADLKAATATVNASGIGAIVASGFATIDQQNQYEAAIEAIMAGKGYGTPTLAGIKGIRDSGGQVTAGDSYLIGLNRQPEIFTPGASGFVTPMGAGGSAAAPTINIYLTQPLGTPQQIAAVVGPALLTTLRGQGMRIVSGA